MTKEDKELLLKDLYARLPYGTIIQVSDWTLLDTELKVGHISQLMNEDLKLKPYLRPMSSMTEGERKEYEILANHCIVTSMGYIHLEATPLIDWLNAYHFDYRGLIPMGLAIKAPKGMYEEKTSQD